MAALGVLLAQPGLFGALLAVLMVTGTPLLQPGTAVGQAWLLLACTVVMVVAGVLLLLACDDTSPAQRASGGFFALLAASTLLGLACALVAFVTLRQMINEGIWQ
jgi:hypothetical protein